MDEGAEKYIDISGRIQGDFLMMEIENSFRGTGECYMANRLTKDFLLFIN